MGKHKHLSEHHRNMSLENIVEEIDGVILVEQWEDCFIHTEKGIKLDFTGYYKVSTFGRVKSVGREIRFHNRFGEPCVRHTVDKILKGEVSVKGYFRVSLTLGIGTKRKYAVHRIVASTFSKNKKNLPQINHEDGRKLNNVVWNLKWCTQEYNQQHAYQTGLNIPKSSWQDSQAVSVVMSSVSTNSKIKFGSMGEAAKKTGIGRTCIRRSCENGKPIKRGKFSGFKFSYI
jgi:hypothetical protein